jgi:hypothetical protein
MRDNGEDDVCPVTNLPRYRCDHCIGTDAPASARGRVQRRTTMDARYPGHCAYCDGPILIGEEIRRIGADWVHTRHYGPWYWPR